MKNRFTIGEMSKLHDISVKTLRYYDEIGLFKPIEVNRDNHYRYYSIDQFEQLHTINYLKFLGITLKEIQSLLEKRDIEEFLMILKKQKYETEIKIKALQNVADGFNNRIKEIELAKEMKHQLNQVLIKRIQERKIIRLKDKISSRVEIELAVRKLEKRSSITSSIIIGKVGITVSKKDIKEMNVNEYNSIFILLEGENVQNEIVETLPQGQYACIYYSGDHSESPKYYKILIDFLHENKYEINGDAIERSIIDQSISGNKNDHLTEIQIPIKNY